MAARSTPKAAAFKERVEQAQAAAAAPVAPAPAVEEQEVLSPVVPPPADWAESSAGPALDAGEPGSTIVRSYWGSTPHFHCANCNFDTFNEAVAKAHRC